MASRAMGTEDRETVARVSPSPCPYGQSVLWSLEASPPRRHPVQSQDKGSSLTRGTFLALRLDVSLHKRVLHRSLASPP